MDSEVKEKKNNGRPKMNAGIQDKKRVLDVSLYSRCFRTRTTTSSLTLT